MQFTYLYIRDQIAKLHLNHLSLEGYDNQAKIIHTTEFTHTLITTNLVLSWLWAMTTSLSYKIKMDVNLSTYFG